MPWTSPPRWPLTSPWCGSRDGSVLWKNSFDETQQSLSQDLLNLGQYMKHGLRWYTAEELWARWA